MFYICICGGRTFVPKEDDKIWLIKTLEGLKNKYIDIVIVEGGARGADQFGKTIALELQIPVKTFKADWNTYGKSAGFKRNSEMIKVSDMLIWFPGGNGTADSISKAKLKGIPILSKYR